MVLTKILQIDQKLTFNVFHNVMEQTPPKKRSFFGARVLNYKDLGYVSGLRFFVRNIIHENHIHFLIWNSMILKRDSYFLKTNSHDFVSTRILINVRKFLALTKFEHFRDLCRQEICTRQELFYNQKNLMSKLQIKSLKC